MGSSFLTVNESWETYVANADGTYRELDGEVKRELVVAEEAKRMILDSLNSIGRQRLQAGLRVSWQLNRCVSRPMH